MFLSGLMMVITPGKAGELWKAWFLRDLESVPVKETTPIVVAERVTDVMGLLVLASTGVVLYDYSSVVLTTLAAVFVVGIVVLQWRSLCERIFARGKRLPRIGGRISAVEDLYGQTYILFRIRPLLSTLGLSVIAWGIEGSALWIVLTGMGADASIMVGIFVFSLGTIIGAISLLPGGIGAAEASMTGLLLAFGYDSAIAISATLIGRLTLWYAALLGFMAYLTHRMRS